MAIISEVVQPIHAQINMMFCDFVVYTWVSDVGCSGCSFTFFPHTVWVSEFLPVGFTIFIRVGIAEIFCPPLHEIKILFGSGSTVCLIQTAIGVKHLSLKEYCALSRNNITTESGL